MEESYRATVLSFTGRHKLNIVSDPYVGSGGFVHITQDEGSLSLCHTLTPAGARDMAVKLMHAAEAAEKGNENDCVV